MAVYTISAGTVPLNTGYPANLQGLLQLLQSYLSVNAGSNLSSVVISASTPASLDNDKVWFQTQPGVSGYPQSIKLYNEGSWKEFTPFNFGDIVLTDANAAISSPWGVGNTSYIVDGITKLTPTLPVAPANAQYKVYVGYYE
jgi:hypothetical protein